MANKYDRKIENIKDLVSEKQIDVAYKKLRKLYKLNPKDNVVKFELAKLMLVMGEDKINTAEKYFSEIYSYNHYSTAKLYMAKIMLLKGEIYNAIKMLNELMGTQSETEALIQLGKIAEGNGRKHIARKYFERARKLRNYADNATLQLGILERREGNNALAEELLKSINEEKYKKKAQKEIEKIYVKKNNRNI